ncbi:hypothetical protein ACJIZ3_009305 [Penstemon smallii]|uniref:Uncharacterized protein n=1 Tax=Penstemon smallii TaxID=265156 RepID=A0ABD3TC72_9LAMI
MAYAAVVSLHQILEQQINLQSDQFTKPEIKRLKSIMKDLMYLLRSLVKIHRLSNSNKNIVNDLDTRIRDAIYAALDTVESYLSGHDTKSIFQEQVEVVIESIDHLTKKADQIRDKLKTILPAADSVSSSKPKFGSKNKIVGLEDDVEELIGKLMREPWKELEVVPIVGMAE